MAASVWMKSSYGPLLDVAAARRDDAGGDGTAEAERIADGEHPVADARAVAVAEMNRRQRAVRVDLQHGQVPAVVVADEGGFQRRVVLQRDGDFVGAVDHVVVGDHNAGWVDDEAGAERLQVMRLAAVLVGSLVRRLILVAIVAVIAVIAIAAAMAVHEVMEELLERRARGGKPAFRGVSALERLVWLELTLTTAGSRFCARSAKLSGAGRAAAGIASIEAATARQRAPRRRKRMEQGIPTV